MKAQLTKAVDGAALAGGAQPQQREPEDRGGADIQGELSRPATSGTTAVTDPTTDANFFGVNTNATTGVNTVTVTASATRADDVHAAGELHRPDGHQLR